MQKPTRSGPPQAPGAADGGEQGDDSRALARAPAHARESQDLVDAFLSARRPGTLRGYRGALAAFSGWTGAPSAAEAARALLGGTQGHANRLAYGWRCHLIEKGYAPSTVNARLSALRALVQLARMHGLVAWGLDVTGVRAEPYRDTRGPGRVGVRALLRLVEGAQTGVGA